MKKKLSYEDQMIDCVKETNRFFNLLRKEQLISEIQHKYVYDILINVTKGMELKQWKS